MLGGGGGTCCTGSGGYSGGASNRGKDSPYGINGLGCDGGGYFGGSQNYYVYIDGEATNKLGANIIFGGMSCQGSFMYNHESGCGGIAGAGGIITVSEDSEIYAYNGNMYTGDSIVFNEDLMTIKEIIFNDGHEYNNGQNQCPIYLQLGIIPKHYVYLTDSRASYCNVTEITIVSDATLSGYINSSISDKISVNELIVNEDKNVLGIGSGAGYIEVSNGTYQLQEVLEEEN